MGFDRTRAQKLDRYAPNKPDKRARLLLDGWGMQGDAGVVSGEEAKADVGDTGARAVRRDCCVGRDKKIGAATTARSKEPGVGRRSPTRRLRGGAGRRGAARRSRVGVGATEGRGLGFLKV